MTGGEKPAMETVHDNLPESASAARNAHRDRIELLRSRVSLLKGKDRLLMTMYLENGNTFRQLARLAGVSEANIARRIRKLTSRLTDSKYVLCLRNRDKLTKAEMTIAKEYFLLGLSQKKIASKHKRTFYQVRNTIEKIQRLIRTADGA
jgi:predicted DNA-binding protein YlxM (UPF0122 family)